MLFSTVIEAATDEDFDMPQAGAKGKERARPVRTQVTQAVVNDNEFGGSQEVEGFSGRTVAPARLGHARTQEKQALFLPDSDQEVEREVSVDQSDQDKSPPTKGKAKGAVGTKRKAVVLAASSSEDEAYDKRRKKRR
jgi:hypothetical protein